MKSSLNDQKTFEENTTSIECFRNRINPANGLHRIQFTKTINKP